MIETCVSYWATQPRTLSRNTLDLLQDEHSKTGEPLRESMHVWGSPATRGESFLLALLFSHFGVVCEGGGRYRGKTPCNQNTDGPLCVCISFELQRPNL